jgi:hypothetical protein
MTQSGIYARGGCNLKQLARKKRRYAQVPCGVWSEVKQMYDPARSEGKDDGVCCESRENRSRELKFRCAYQANQVPRSRGSKGIGEQVPTGWPKQLCNSTHSVWTEDGQPTCALGKIECQGREAECRSKGKANQNDCQSLQRYRHRSEVKRNRDMRAERDECSSADCQEYLSSCAAAKIFAACSGAGLEWDCRLHGASFQRLAETVVSKDIKRGGIVRRASALNMQRAGGRN